MTTRPATYGMPVAPGALADIAHELSSIQDWKTRIENSLSMLHDVFPPCIVALGVQVEGWETFYCPAPEDEDELEDILARHYLILTGQENLDMTAMIGAETGTPSTIREAAGAPGSFISLPVVGADEMLGVLHVSTDIDDAYTIEDVSVLSIVASQVGGDFYDVFFLYTDGIIDARSHGRFLGIDGVSEMLTAKASCDEAQIADEILEGATSFAEGNLQDDAAILVIKAK